MSKQRAQIEDQVLVMDAQNGDRQALETLVRRWQKRLWQHTYRLTAESQACWDITQQSWLDIIKGLRKLRDPARFPTWAYRIVTNKAADWLKSKQKRNYVNIDDVAPAETPSSENADVRELLQKLKENSRVILSLYYFEEFTVSEISQVLKAPVGTVKSRLFQARKEFNELWSKTQE